MEPEKQTLLKPRLTEIFKVAHNQSAKDMGEPLPVYTDESFYDYVQEVSLSFCVTLSRTLNRLKKESLVIGNNATGFTPDFLEGLLDRLMIEKSDETEASQLLYGQFKVWAQTGALKSNGVLLGIEDGKLLILPTPSPQIKRTPPPIEPTRSARYGAAKPKP